MTSAPNRRWFRFLLSTVFVLVTVLAVGIGWTSHELGERERLSALIRSLPDIGTDYKVDPYIRAVADLQAMPRAKAVDTLMAIARDLHGDRAIVLCRMLFTSKANGEFRRPRLGAPAVFGGTDYADWPLEPIELVDGVPFLITRGYKLGGEAEQPQNYVQYCLESCDWNQTRFAAKGHVEKQNALAKLLASTKWKMALSKDEKVFLSSQTR